MKNFTVEEINLMCCFNTSSRKRLIDDMKSVTLNDMDGEIAELMYKTVRKLEVMTDAEFEELYIMPDGIMDRLKSAKAEKQKDCYPPKKHKGEIEL